MRVAQRRGWAETDGNAVMPPRFSVPPSVSKARSAVAQQRSAAHSLSAWSCGPRARMRSLALTVHGEPRRTSASVHLGATYGCTHPRQARHRCSRSRRLASRLGASRPGARCAALHSGQGEVQDADWSARVRDAGPSWTHGRAARRLPTPAPGGAGAVLVAPRGAASQGPPAKQSSAASGGLSAAGRARGPRVLAFLLKPSSSPRRTHSSDTPSSRRSRSPSVALRRRRATRACPPSALQGWRMYNV